MKLNLDFLYDIHVSVHAFKCHWKQLIEDREAFYVLGFAGFDCSFWKKRRKKKSHFAALLEMVPFSTDALLQKHLKTFGSVYSWGVPYASLGMWSC